MCSSDLKGEFQLTDALQNMKNKGLVFKVGQVKEWLDCGNKNATVETNSRVLENIGSSISKKSIIKNSVIIDPCFIDDDVKILNSVVGPHVSISSKTQISNCIISNSIIQSNSNLSNSNCTNSMIGNECDIKLSKTEFNYGDFIQISD